MRFCHCIMGRDGHCCQETITRGPDYLVYPYQPVFVNPDGERIEDLEKRIEELTKLLTKTKKKRKSK